MRRRGERRKENPPQHLFSFIFRHAGTNNRNAAEATQRPKDKEQ